MPKAARAKTRARADFMVMVAWCWISRSLDATWRRETERDADVLDRDPSSSYIYLQVELLRPLLLAGGRLKDED